MLTIGSRGSQLALWQANWVKARLEELGAGVPHRDHQHHRRQDPDVPLKEVGTKGLFTKEIEEALLEGRIDLAVHSLKDMPTELPEGLQITATPKREDPRDAIIGSTLADLKQGATVGTSSLRRVAQLCAYRADLQVEPMRGNVDTRLRKLDEGQFDAIVLAAAGLKRLGWDGRIAERIPVEIMCPAVGQGALAIETRDEGDAIAVVARLDHADTNASVTAERAVLAALGGGCQVPIGAHATIEGGRIHIRGVVSTTDGKRLVHDEIEGDASEGIRLGTELGERLLGAGAREILAAVYGK